jgi:hypothetical protein
MLPGSRQNHEVLEETRPLEARHGPLVCGYALVSANLVPSYGLKFHCFVDGEGKASEGNSEDKSSLGPVMSLLPSVIMDVNAWCCAVEVSQLLPSTSDLSTEGFC